ncbi:MAG: hypothetical protein WBA40_03315 [Roseiarcus sp.]
MTESRRWNRDKPGWLAQALAEAGAGFQPAEQLSEGEVLSLAEKWKRCVVSDLRQVSIAGVSNPKSSEIFHISADFKRGVQK